MKAKQLGPTLLLILATGCAVHPPQRSAWEIQPLVSVRHSGQNAQAYYDLGRYHHHQRRREQAESAYLRAVALDDKHADALNALGVLYAERGEPERSVHMFKAAAAKKPEAAYLHNNLGFSLSLQGRHQEAYAAIHQALILDPGLERAWANLAGIAAACSDEALAELARSRRLAGMPSAIASPSLQESAAVPAAPPTSRTPPEDPAKATLFRLELSNGNGIARFAARFREQLQADGIPVQRLSSRKPYGVAITVVEYQPGYEETAKALMARTGIQGQLKPAKAPRTGIDIRFVLGRDAVGLLKSSSA